MVDGLPVLKNNELYGNTDVCMYYVSLSDVTDLCAHAI